MSKPEVDLQPSDCGYFHMSVAGLDVRQLWRAFQYKRCDDEMAPLEKDAIDNNVLSR